MPFNTKYFIVEALFPFTDVNVLKKRPVLVLTQPKSKYNSVIAAFISSKIPSDLLETDLSLKPDELNGLLVNSVIRLHKLTTLEQENLGEIIGKLDIKLSELVQRKIKKLFNL